MKPHSAFVDRPGCRVMQLLAPQEIRISVNALTHPRTLQSHPYNFEEGSHKYLAHCLHSTLGTSHAPWMSACFDSWLGCCERLVY